MKNLAWLAGLLGISLSLIACGGDATGSTSTTGAGGTTTTATATATGSGGTGGAGSGTTATSTGATGSSTGATGTGGGAPAPEAPMMMSAAKVPGGLHVMWMNVTMGCDKIELSRKHDAGAYAVAYTLNGSATAQHDTQAVAPGMYCYTARCLKGGQTSPDSNEKCGTP